ncbi:MULTISPECIES: hypothetical protein [Streptomyces]|uniref:Integral membrane protein n=1 Tax=Streptomyces virginiae TaxID=1961 RepID=A0ABQ3P0N1_STRVG|nr:MULTISPECIES: hypothetical protein [Streptomyces]GLV91739.1 hypothetical protein Slala04_31930 [Streptomyces lavendulae subsp. lavendulae]MBP2344187.1 hypothetical protein [Streptomyces virginiae]RST08528.1 hypothetical protein EF904_16490 [Streptomyces sp. WAC05950]GGQ40165.1 hypothetical protein GCM10010215_74670 [Streptomyces virginiae]GHI18580.1 hypothetical protein Scinn_80430 [Streptomyces virginiae]
MADDDAGASTPPGRDWVSTLATIAAPTTFIGALLLYFGVSYTSAFYNYFGVDSATLGFSTQDYALRSASALYLPVGSALLVALVGTLIYYAAVAMGKRDTPPPLAIRLSPVALAACGGGLFLLGMLGGLRVWGVGAMEMPLLLSGGLVLLLYSRVLSFKLAGADYPVVRERVAVGLVLALVALASFWAAHEYAKSHGFDDAKYLAGHLRLRPTVTIDTTERLYIPHRQVRETVLPAAVGTSQRFRYRYEGLRLLAEQKGRMFLIPENWSPSCGSVVVLPANSTVRVAFRSG